ncbi:MAG: 3-phosphoshikimate 1-carboxyvinyltransferase [Polyangiaceae bacterium]|nr:3-phosphoshikimate 1-carboxyvinyltransferase [Polyangiaceae bacterium]
MTDLAVEPQHKPLKGIVPVPSDKSITHRALLLAAIAEGESAVVVSSMGDDNRSTLAAMVALGATATERENELRIGGVGLEGLRAASGAIDCGNSGTTMRLLAGVLAAQRFQAVLVGDASLTKRPMARIANPLRQRGARIEGELVRNKPGEITAPLVIGPLPVPNVLSAISFDSPIPSAQVKSALLLSGLYADGSTVVSEPVVSRDHTERMLDALGVPVQRAGSIVSLDGGAFSGKLPAFSLTVPGDLSAAAFLAAAASLVPGSEVGVRGVGANPTRSGFVDAIRMMGANVELSPETVQLGEPVGLLRTTHAELRGVTIAGELVARSIDEIPILAALAARAHGVTTIADAGELRVKESDRIACMAAVLRAFGVEVEERRDGLVVEGKPDRPLTAADVDSEGDHRIAMSAAVLGLFANGTSRVRNVDAIATSFPRFAGTMRALGANIRAV